MDVKADQGQIEPQEKRGPQTPDDPEMVIQQQLMDEERVLNALVVEGNKARQETMPGSGRTYNPREPCHASNQLQTSVPETVGDSSEVVNLSKSESTKTRKRRVGAGQGEIPTMVNDAPKALPRRGARRAAKGTVRSQESDLRLVAGHGGERNTAQQRREVPDDDGFEEDQLYRIHGMAPVGPQIDATSKPMMDLPAGDLKRKRDEVTEANRADTEDGGNAIAKPTLGVLPKENRDGLFKQSKEARFKTTEVTSKRRKVVQRAGEDGPPTEDAHARSGRTSEAEEQTLQQRRIQPQRRVKITRNDPKSRATVGRWELKMAQANRTQRADDRRTIQKRLGMAEVEVEAQRYRELSSAVNKYLIVAIVEALEDSKKTRPTNSRYAMAQIPDGLLGNISTSLLRDANIAGYYMAVSLLVRRRKFDLYDLPNSAQIILKPVLDLLDAKSYEPCIHPDFRCTNSHCYEQWYVLCCRGERDTTFEDFKQRYQMPKEKEFASGFRTYISIQTEKFSGDMIYQHELTKTLYTKDSIDVLMGRMGAPLLSILQKPDADCDMMGSQPMDLHKELATLRSKSENIQELTKANEELALEGDKLRNEVAKYKETISDLNKQIKTLREDQERLESEHTQHEQTIKTQSGEISRLEQEKAAWEIERVELEGTQEESKSEFTMLQNKHSIEIRALAQKHEDQDRLTQTEISDLKENIKILKEENNRDKEMHNRENEMAETELQRLRTETTKHQKENKELTEKLADEGRNAKSTIDKQTTIITGLESVILSYIQRRVKWAKGLELHELRKQVESLRVQINNQSDADHGAIYELCNKIHMSRNLPSVDDELRRLEDEHKKTIKGGIEVVRQFFISMDRDEADSKDVERAVKREEPDPNKMSSALQSAGLRCTPMLEHMKPFFSQEFRNNFGADMTQPTDMYNIYRPIFLLLQRFLQNKGTMKHKLSVLQEEHSECDKNLQTSKRSAEALQTRLDNKTKSAANKREELSKLKAQWSEVHELIKTALGLYETKSSTGEDLGDEGSAESRIKTSEKTLARSSSRGMDKNTDVPIGGGSGGGFDKSRNQYLEQRIKDCLGKGDLADRAVLRRWHIMWCGCENFRIDGDVVSTTGTCKLHGVPATVSASSDASNLCCSLLGWMEGVFSYRKETLRALKIEVCNREKEIDKLRQTGTEREATAKKTLELLEQNIAHETKRYGALKERFDTIEQGSLILNFVASVQDKTQNSDVVLEPRPKSGEWTSPQQNIKIVSPYS
ncbi:hypothetical protein H634G_11357 [Metarhizium anisopliae BRIP 53293]|uniref:Uncharacterized protein n=1 Tax=Metarhizium anisopliae BRIP 53293 TaxID=1291518 RepID=A0A0D9NHG7_METAN|nr:hypothetical protein H634G_11357 [Metarhizium anisopliae BRIP 53293]